MLLDELTEWLDENNCISVDEIRGAALKNSETEHELLSRVQYVKALEDASEFYKF